MEGNTDLLMRLLEQFEKQHDAILGIDGDISEDNLQALEALLAEVILGIRSSL
jgi:hypothetical protein